MLEASIFVRQADYFREQGCESRQGLDWRMEKGEATEQTYSTDVGSLLLTESKLKEYAFGYSFVRDCDSMKYAVRPSVSIFLASGLHPSKRASSWR